MAEPNAPKNEYSKVKDNVVDGGYNSYYNPSTGDFVISKGEPTSSSFEQDIIYKNGQYLDKKGTLPDTLFKDGKLTPLAETIHTQVNADVKKAHQGIGGTAGGNKINSATNTEKPTLESEGTSSSPNILEQVTESTSEAVQGLTKLISDLINNATVFPNIDDYGTDMASIFLNRPLFYPEDIHSKSQDILIINQYSYKSPYNDVFRGNQKDTIYQNGAQRLSALNKLIGTVTLPIPNNVSDSNSAGWGDDRTSTGAMAAAGQMEKAISALGIQAAANLAQNIPGIPGQAASIIANNANAIFQVLSGGVNNPALSSAIQALILQRLSFEVSPESILARGYGVVPNSNVELLFNGPTLRGFNFAYDMTPRSSKEAEICRLILRFFKQGMAPKKKRSSSSGYGESSFFLATPNVFKLSYKTINSKNEIINIKGLNRFKICALTNMQASYSEGMWAAYDEGQPARMKMVLSFKELEPVYESDYQSNPSSSLKDQKDQDPIQNDEIGY